MKKALLAVTLLLFWASFAVAQRAGVATFSASDVHEFDTVNLTTLVPTFTFPIVSKGVGALPGNIILESPQVCNAVNAHYANCINAVGFAGGGIWTVKEPMLTKMATVYTTVVNGTCSTYTVTGLLGPDNLTTYSLPSTTLVHPSTCTGSTTATVTTNDGSGYTVGLSSVSGGPVITSLTNTSGWTSSFGSTNTVDDAFSNSISDSSTAFTDSLGAATTYISNGWQYVDTGGNNQDVTYTNGTALAFSPYGCSNTMGPTTFTPTTSINYPDSTAISIGWDKSDSTHYSGLIGSITLRTGGTITYAYTGIPGTCVPWYFTSITRTTADGTTSYSISTANNSTTTTVKDPGLNKTVYVFVGNGNLGTTGPAPTFISTIDRYQNTGTVASPSYTHISETSYCYNTHISDCSTYIPAYPITQLDTYQYTYNGATQVTMSHDVKQYDSTYGLITSDAATDSITSQTITTTYVYGTYSSGTCSAITNTKIVDHPCTVTTKNGSTWLSESTYTYNANGALTSSSACLSSTCSGSSALTTTYTPTAQGTYSAIQDPNGQTVNYTYGSCNSLMPTDVTTTVNSIAIDHKATWNCNAGVKTDVTDANSNEADFTYDSMNRISRVHDFMGDTNTTSYAYGTPTLDHVKVTDNIGVVSYTYNDGLGRPTVQQTCQTSGCTNLDTVSYTYGWKDSGNNALTNFQTTTSVPCVTTAVSSTCSTVALTALTNPIAGPYKTTDYNSGTGTYAVNSKDFSFTAGPAPSSQEHTKVVQTEVDGFGRVSSTCALESSGGTSCGQTMGNSGILTSNVYSFATGAPKVVTTRGSQSHTTIADELGRTTSLTTPEGGTVTDVYDTVSTADNCYSANATSAGDLMHHNNADSSYVCSLYDGLHRPTDIKNSVDSTTSPCKRFRYDSTANKWHSGPTGYPSSGDNIIGRLFEAETDNCTSPFNAITDEWFAYDAMGRMTDLWELDPNSSSVYRHTTAAYDADGVPTSLSGIPNVSTITYGVDGEERWNTAKFGTTTIVSAVTYDAASRATEIDIGAGTDKDTYSFDNVGNMTQYQFFVGSANNKGVLTWNSIGSLGQLAVTDGLNTNNTQTCKFGTSTTAGYDDVGRILDDDCGTVWAATYSYDQYDNITKSGSASWGCSTCYSSTNNQQTMTPALTYDSNGNVKSDGTNTYTWNVYNKKASENSTNVTYDAFDQMVAFGTYEHIYGPLGRIGAFSSGSPAVLHIPAPGGGMMQENSAGGFNYYHNDWIGSTRVASTVPATGNGVLNWSRSFSPYGDPYNNPSTDVLFAGIGQDTFTGITYTAPNRELQANASRWISPDPAHSGWNAYAYVTDPNTQTDRSGLGVEGQQDEQYLCPTCNFPDNLTGIPNCAVDPNCFGGNGGPGLVSTGTGSSPDPGPSINSNNTFSGGTPGNIFSGSLFDSRGSVGKNFVNNIPGFAAGTMYGNYLFQFWIMNGRGMPAWPTTTVNVPPGSLTPRAQTLLEQYRRAQRLSNMVAQDQQEGAKLVEDMRKAVYDTGGAAEGPDEFIAKALKGGGRLLLKQDAAEMAAITMRGLAAASGPTIFVLTNVQQTANEWQDTTNRPVMTPSHTWGELFACLGFGTNYCPQ